jgi:hypothetical protein
MTCIDGFISPSERMGWEGCRLFSLSGSPAARKRAGDEVGFAGFAKRAWRAGGAGDPGGEGPRTLFDNFIGRKRDVDGGVLAGLVSL